MSTNTTRKVKNHVKRQPREFFDRGVHCLPLREGGADETDQYQMPPICDFCNLVNKRKILTCPIDRSNQILKI